MVKRLQAELALFQLIASPRYRARWERALEASEGALEIFQVSQSRIAAPENGGKPALSLVSDAQPTSQSPGVTEGTSPKTRT
jgi:hypothetical protein